MEQAQLGQGGSDSDVEESTIEEQERSNRPSRFEPRNFESVDDPQADRMDYRNRRMEEALGISFINTRRTQESEPSVMDELGVDEI